MTRHDKRDIWGENQQIPKSQAAILNKTIIEH